MTTGPAEALMAAGDLGFLDEDALAAFIAERRWFGARQRAVSSARIADAVPISSDPPLAIALAEMQFQTGIHDTYQLLLGLRPADGPADSGVWPVDGAELYDAFEDPRDAGVLLERIRDGATIGNEASAVEFHPAAPDRLEQLPGRPRSAGREQSNSSVVFDDRMILKCYRRLEPGINPELEVLRFLGERGFPHTPLLLGWFEHRGPPVDATLGMLQEYRAGAQDGWEMVLAALLDGSTDDLMPALGSLGAATGELHAALASERNDPAFIPEEISPEALALMSASLDEFAADLFAHLPDEPALAPISARGDEVRDRLGAVSKSTGLGRKIRTHGDLHLGQALWSDGRWYLIDFEGEPARPVSERRRKHSPLRDVAGLLRSFAYAAGSAELHHGVSVPAAWHLRAREALLNGYYAVVEPTGLLPPSGGVTEEVLDLYELEKAVYELRYELEHRPGWVPIPVQAITTILDRTT